MNDAPVVCNTSPLIKLAGVGLLHLLPQLYGTILVPEQVLHEYTAGIEPDSPDLQAFPWLVTKHVAIAPSLQTLAGLGLGEAAAISLALAQRARLILLDDKRARRIAVQQGLVVVGTLGVLVRARWQGQLAAVRPVLDLMIAQGRYISPALLAQVLQAAGESDIDQ